MARKITTLNRWEKITSKPWAVNSTVRFTKAADFDNSRWLRSLAINIRGTVVLATANATAILADNVGAIVEQLLMFGKSMKRGSSDNFCQVRGCDLKEERDIYSGVSIYDNSTTIAVATGTYNLDFWLIYDFPPPRMRVEEQMGYLFDMPNWGQFELDLQFADEKNIWNPSTTTFTWSAQTIDILGRYAMESEKFNGFSVGLRYVQFSENATAQLTTTANQVNLLQLDNKAKIRALLLKTGVKSTTTTAGNNAYASLSDSILANLRIVEAPSQKFREFNRFRDLKAITGFNYKRNPALGYALIDLASDELPFEALDPSTIATGKAGTTNLWLQADVTGAANQALTVIQESLYYSDQIVIPRS